MLDKKILEDLSARINLLVAESPVANLEKNLQALLQGAFARLDLVTREEFDAQTEVLLQARNKLEQLEKKLAELEARNSPRE